jgi:hypothetical protein
LTGSTIHTAREAGAGARIAALARSKARAGDKVAHISIHALIWQLFLSPFSSLALFPLEQHLLWSQLFVSNSYMANNTLFGGFQGTLALHFASAPSPG